MAIGRTIRDDFDWPLFIAVSTIALFGVLNLYSATDGGTTSDAYVQQLYWLILGFGVAGLTVAIDYRHFERYGWVIYGACILALVLVFGLGRSVRGSTRWIALGGFSLQPSELMKIGLIIALAKYLHHDTKTGGRTLVDLIIPGLILALPMGLVLLQPDLGTAMVLAFIFASLMMLTQLKMRSVVTLLATFVVAAPVTWFYLLKDYQKERITAFWGRVGGTQTDLLDSGWHTHQ
ncbi:MAG: FtsW/RodA/SpoVE family cell cycle protein, partial [Deltaproteobacteria bacterium]|nr:FtsW/RodA/SpoVE family cell cycle protein [Deltaproteobacteria bacterium]